MSKNSAAHQKKVEHAVQKILKAPGLSIPDAMVLANFSKKDVANKTLRRAVHRAVKLCQDQALLGLRAPPPTDGIIILEDPSPSLSDLSSSLTGESSALSASQFPKPKRKQIRPTSSAVEQRHVNDLKAKRHKSNAHKAAVRLYDVEKQKPNGMSVRKVLSVILAKFEVCPSRSTIARYAKHGLVIASPMKMGPTGLLSTMAYKFLCQAYLSLIQINQMNACTGDNSRKEMIPMLVKTFNIGILDATGLLNHVVCNTATDIHMVKLNFVEDRRIRWTTYQNLDLWFDSWEVFLVDYGFATINMNGELLFGIEMMK